MLNQIKTFIAAAVLTGTVGASAQAATVTVKQGDTLWDLARENHTSVENIQKLNHLTTDIIHPGDQLTVTPETRYTVQEGDTLWGIAKNHHVTVSQLKEWNNLMTDLIHPGLNLLVFDGAQTSTEVNPAPTKVEAASTSAPAQAQAQAQPVANAAQAQPATADPKPAAPSNKVITVKATAYTASCAGCSGTTKTGIDLKANPDAKVIAVDPNVIPLGTKVYVEGYGEAIAGDTGGAIKGNRIDIFIPSEQKAEEFGVQQVKVTILN